MQTHVLIAGKKNKSDPNVLVDVESDAIDDFLPEHIVTGNMKVVTCDCLNGKVLNSYRLLLCKNVFLGNAKVRLPSMSRTARRRSSRSQ